MEYMEAKMQDQYEGAEQEREAIWDEVRRLAKDQIGESAISGMPPDFPSNNPHSAGTWRHEEWEAAHEHYIMTGLGY